MANRGKMMSAVLASCAVLLLTAAVTLLVAAWPWSASDTYHASYTVVPGWLPLTFVLGSLFVAGGIGFVFRDAKHQGSRMPPFATAALVLLGSAWATVGIVWWIAGGAVAT